MGLKAYRNELTGRWTLEGVEPSADTFDRICKMLVDQVPFKFARYGDGEFFCMAGKVGRNCDKHEYFPDLGAALREAWYSDPDYIVGVQPLSVSGGLYQKVSNAGPKNIVDADVLHSASIDGRIHDFNKSLISRSTILVGPKHLEKIAPTQMIVISDLNCWKWYEDTCELINVWCEQIENPVLLLCASMMSEVIIHRFRNTDATFIDCGSVFDPYAGKLSRSYHHKLKL